MKLFTTKTAIMAAISAVAVSGQKWQDDVQVCALSVMAHVQKHREVSLVNTLIEALPKGARTNAMRDYFVEFSQAEYVEAVGKKAAHFAFNKNKKTDMVGATAISWAAFTAEKPYVPLDICHLLTNLVKRAEKDDKTEYDPALIAGIKSLVAKAEPKPEAVPVTA